MSSRRRQRSSSANAKSKSTATAASGATDGHDAFVVPEKRGAWVVVGGAGNIGRLTLKQLDMPAVGDNDVLIGVRAIGLNFADVFSVLSLYSATPSGDFIPGLEVAGTVLRMGAAVQKQGRFRVGQRVFGFTRFGGYAEAVAVRSEYVRPIPEHYSFADAAALLGQALTAFYGLDQLGDLRRLLHVRRATGGPPVNVLIHSGAGGTGLWAIRLAQLFAAPHGDNINIVTTVGSAGKVALLTQPRAKGGLLPTPLPARAVIDRAACGDSSSAVAAALKAALPAGQQDGDAKYDVVFDSLLGPWFAPTFNTMLRPMARHVVLGAGSMTPAGESPNWLTLGWKWLTRPTVDPLECISLNKSLMCFNLIWLTEQHQHMNMLVDDMLAVLGGGAPGRLEVPVVGTTFDFSQVPDALRLFQSGTTHGKVVVTVGGNE